MKLPSENAGPNHSINNLFLAFLPEGQACSEVDNFANRLKSQYKLEGEPLGPSRYHVSLFSFGHFANVPPGTAAQLGDQFAGLVAQTDEFEICFDRALSFKNNGLKRPLVLGCTKKNKELMEFVRKLTAPLGRRRSSYTPHITLLYDAKEVSERSVQPVCWTVTKMTLVHSYVGLGRHDHLEHWPLRSAPLSSEQIDMPF